MGRMTDHPLPDFACDGVVARVTMRDGARRNALDARALDALAEAISGAAASGASVVVLSGEGPAFCAGFDLARCAAEPREVGPLLVGLSACVAALRAIDAPVVARVQGAALAGGCALLTACDFVVAAADAQLGYPTHRIGISPAVSIPTLLSRMGPAARALLLSNEIVDGRTAHARGLATHCAESAALDGVVEALVARLVANGPVAMRETKRWIREIERRGAGASGPARGIDGASVAAARDASLALAAGEEFSTMLRAFWAARREAR
jgi:methylglutaconyl-CoA hydratase